MVDRDMEGGRCFATRKKAKEGPLEVAMEQKVHSDENSLPASLIQCCNIHSNGRNPCAVSGRVVFLPAEAPGTDWESTLELFCRYPE